MQPKKSTNKRNQVHTLWLSVCPNSDPTRGSLHGCLTVFFHAYAPQSAAAQGWLSAAALPAARRALLAGPTPAKSAAPQLLRYVLSLLQVRCDHMPFVLTSLGLLLQILSVTPPMRNTLWKTFQGPLLQRLSYL